MFRQRLPTDLFLYVNFKTSFDLLCFINVSILIYLSTLNNFNTLFDFIMFRQRLRIHLSLHVK